MITPKPYKDIEQSENTFVRVFNNNLNESELVWHRDKNDRVFTVLEGSGWKVQFDNEKPILMEQGKSYTIPKMVYHRIFEKGKDDLVVKILEK